MKYRTFPGTTLEASVVGMGCWAMGGMWWGDDVNDADSIAAVHAALDLGINVFDTAPLYGYGHADEVLVKALGSQRHDVIIATKVGVRFKGPSGHAQSDLTADHIVEDTETSLKRLQLEQIPLLQIHWPCELNTPFEETMGALVRLKEQGKIAHIGACNYNHAGLSGLMEHGPVAALQIALSMVRQRYEPVLERLCTGQESGQPAVGVVAYEPLCRGLLTGKYNGPMSFAPDDVRSNDDWFKGDRFQRVLGFVKVLEKVAEKVGTTVPALAVAWTANRPGVTTTIVGAKRPQQIQETAAIAGLLDHPKLWPILNGIVDRQPRL